MCVCVRMHATMSIAKDTVHCISCLRLPQSIFHSDPMPDRPFSSTSLCLRLMVYLSLPLSLSLSLSLPTEKFYFHNLKLLAIRSAFSGWNWKANIYTIILKWFKNSLKCLLTVFCFYFYIRIHPTHSHPKIVVCCQSSRHRDAHTQFARQWFIQFRNSNFPYHANFRVFTHLFCFCFSIRSRAHPTRTNSDLLNI